MGLAGVVRGRRVRTTVPDPAASCPLDRVNRQFRADCPNRLWVADFTDIATWAGFVYAAFVIDVFARRVVGWRVSRSARADFVLEALEKALHERRPFAGGGLVCQSDRGSQYVSIRKTEGLAEAGIGIAPVWWTVDCNFAAAAPNQLWVADITYVPTAARFLYLAVVLDAFSRRIVG